MHKSKSNSDESVEEYTQEEIALLDKYHNYTNNQFEDDDIYDVILKFNHDDLLIKEELKEMIKDLRKGEEYHWHEIGKKKDKKQKGAKPTKEVKETKDAKDIPVKTWQKHETVTSKQGYYDNRYYPTDSWYQTGYTKQYRNNYGNSYSRYGGYSKDGYNTYKKYSGYTGQRYNKRRYYNNSTTIPVEIGDNNIQGVNKDKTEDNIDNPNAINMLKQEMKAEEIEMNVEMSPEKKYEEYVIKPREPESWRDDTKQEKNEIVEKSEHREEEEEEHFEKVRAIAKPRGNDEDVIKEDQTKSNSNIMQNTSEEPEKQVFEICVNTAFEMLGKPKEEKKILGQGSYYPYGMMPAGNNPYFIPMNYPFQYDHGVNSNNKNVNLPGKQGVNNSYYNYPYYFPFAPLTPEQQSLMMSQSMPK